MPPHTWRKRSSFTIDGYMWIVLNQANIPKRHSGGYWSNMDTYGGKRICSDLLFELTFSRINSAG